ncbi:MAG: HD domain-containing protein [Chloroflexi bacterium]|nr:HD domain-containing protein [Chloroflexota bacterium]
MTKQDIIQKTTAYIKQEFRNDSSGHDWWHIYRVWKNALNICEHEQADMFIVQLAALLHDIDDWKFNPNGDETPIRAKAWLDQCKVDAEISRHVCEIIAHLSFKGAGVENKINTIEGMIVQDADRLDAIGAVGIGRAFAYGGYKGRPLYDPDAPPQLHATFEQYKNSQSATINHFHEKLFLLKDMMNTSTAKHIAEERHTYMLEFVERFMQEWDGADFPR